MLFAALADLEYLRDVPDGVDGIELRLDLFQSLDSLEKVFSTIHLPVVFKARRSEALIRALFRLNPAYFDLEYDMRPEFLDWAFAQGIKIILSHHNYQKTPHDIESIYQVMRAYPAITYKIATHANCANDALRLLRFAQEHPGVSAISMGEKGQFARVLGPIVGNYANYGYVGKPTAPGQFSAQELISTYRFPKLNPETAIFGLIGDPVSQSLGALYHNQEFEELNAVYVKVALQASELNEFFPLAKSVGFRGLSVTMPLKEKVMPELGSVNTILLDEMVGLNCDGPAALDAMGEVNGKTMVLLGAGGAASAIAVEAIQRGARVIILNRTVARAKGLATRLGCQFGSLDEVPLEYDLLVNCTPSPMPIDPNLILPSATVMDIVYVPKETFFLQAAALRGAKTISGEVMFQNQAKAQSKLWKNCLRKSYFS